VVHLNQCTVLENLIRPHVEAFLVVLDAANSRFSSCCVASYVCTGLLACVLELSCLFPFFFFFSFVFELDAL
jgi:hypothetical protein